MPFRWKLIRPFESLLRRKEDELERSGKWREAQKLRQYQLKLQGGVSDDTSRFMAPIPRHRICGKVFGAAGSVPPGAAAARLSECRAIKLSGSEEMQRKSREIEEQLETVNKNYWQYCCAGVVNAVRNHGVTRGNWALLVIVRLLVCVANSTVGSLYPTTCFNSTSTS